MIWIGGVMDGRMNRKLVGFAGLYGLFILAYIVSLASGTHFFLRFIF